MLCIQVKIPLLYRENNSYVKCADGVFGELADVPKACFEYRAGYLVQIAADRVEGVRAKTLILNFLKS